MGYAMKYTNGKKADRAAFPFKTDLTKKTGLGPRENETIRVSNQNEAGGLVSEDELESKFKKKGGNPKDYPQLSVQDYSEVKEDDMGKYVQKLGDNETAAPYGSPNNYAFGNYSKVADTQLGCDACDNGRKPCNCK